MKKKIPLHLTVASGDESGGGASASKKARYCKELLSLQVELVKLQRHLIEHNDKVLILFEGRDAAGKDGVIKRIVEHLSPRETHVVALGKPSDRTQQSWYFQRYVKHLPHSRELVLFNRSWYNRAGVETVMGFCTDDECEKFLQTVPAFETLLIQSGITLFKYYLDISRAEQKRRLANRKSNPLKQWKISEIDNAAQGHWQGYSDARDAMLLRTHTQTAPWSVVRTDDKRAARINVIKDVLQRTHYAGKRKSLLQSDPGIVLPFRPALVSERLLAP